MPLNDALLAVFDHELQNTRRTLERVPEGKSDWKPHPKSMALGYLAGHLAELAGWGAVTMETTEFDMASVPYQPFTMTSREVLLAKFDENSAKLRAALGKATDTDLMIPWSLKRGSEVIFSLPRVAALRSMILNHIIHHRGQLTVYLRLNDVPVPALYGPSADEGQAGAAQG